MIAEYVYFGLRPVAVKNGSNINIVHTDYLTTPRIVTSGGSIVWQWRNDNPYGNNLAQGTIEFNLRFAGQYYDAESGFHYNIHRTYNPEIGRYMQSDPMGLLAGSNTYNYVGRNPFDGVDPLGLIEWGDYSLPQGFVNTMAGIGDGITTNLTLGIVGTQNIRSLLNIEGIDTNSSCYSGGYVGGTIISNVVYLKGAIPNKLVHFTTKEGAIGIEKIGKILPSKAGLTGKGVYATAIDNNPGTLGKAFLGDTSLKNIPIYINDTSKYLRIIPNLIYMNGYNIQLPVMIGTIDMTANKINKLLY